MVYFCLNGQETSELISLFIESSEAVEDDLGLNEITGTWQAKIIQLQHRRAKQSQLIQRRVKVCTLDTVESGEKVLAMETVLDITWEVHVTYVVTQVQEEDILKKIKVYVLETDNDLDDEETYYRLSCIHVKDMTASTDAPESVKSFRSTQEAVQASILDGPIIVCYHDAKLFYMQPDDTREVNGSFLSHELMLQNHNSSKLLFPHDVIMKAAVHSWSWGCSIDSSNIIQKEILVRFELVSSTNESSYTWKRIRHVANENVTLELKDFLPPTSIQHIDAAHISCVKQLQGDSTCFRTYIATVDKTLYVLEDGCIVDRRVLPHVLTDLYCFMVNATEFILAALYKDPDCTLELWTCESMRTLQEYIGIGRVLFGSFDAFSGEQALLLNHKYNGPSTSSFVSIEKCFQDYILTNGLSTQIHGHRLKSLVSSQASGKKRTRKTKKQNTNQENQVDENTAKKEFPQSINHTAILIQPTLKKAPPLCRTKCHDTFISTGRFENLRRISMSLTRRLQVGVLHVRKMEALYERKQRAMASLLLVGHQLLDSTCCESTSALKSMSDRMDEKRVNDKSECFEKICSFSKACFRLDVVHEANVFPRMVNILGNSTPSVEMDCPCSFSWKLKVNGFKHRFIPKTATLFFAFHLQNHSTELVEDISLNVLQDKNATGTTHGIDALLPGQEQGCEVSIVLDANVPWQSESRDPRDDFKLFCILADGYVKGARYVQIVHSMSLSQQDLLQSIIVAQGLEPQRFMDCTTLALLKFHAILFSSTTDLRLLPDLLIRLHLIKTTEHFNKDGEENGVQINFLSPRYATVCVGGSNEFMLQLLLDQLEENLPPDVVLVKDRLLSTSSPSTIETILQSLDRELYLIQRCATVSASALNATQENEALTSLEDVMRKQMDTDRIAASLRLETPY